MNFFSSFNCDTLKHTFDFLTFQEQAQLSTLNKTTAQLVSNCEYQQTIRMCASLDKKNLVGKTKEYLDNIKTNVESNYTKAIITGVFVLMLEPNPNFQRTICMKYFEGVNHKTKKLVKQTLKQCGYSPKFKPHLIVKFVSQTPSFAFKYMYHSLQKSAISVPECWYDTVSTPYFSHFLLTLPLLSFNPIEPLVVAPGTQYTFTFHFVDMTVNHK